MLMGVPHVSTATVAMLEGAISSRRLLVDWPASDLAELLENPLFVHKGRDAEAVQLPQGPLSHFLGARWFAERVRHGLTGEDLRAMTLTRVQGEDRYEVPEARRRIIGWLASEVADLRKLIMSAHPEVVLFEGDPDRLSDPEIQTGLRLLCDAIATGRWDGGPTPATSRRLARPTIEADVMDLLRRHKDSPKVLQLLLRLVEHGRYQRCAAEVLALASASTDSLVRSFAVEAFAASVPEQRLKLLSLTSDRDEYVRLALLRSLVPDVLFGRALVDFVAVGGGHAVRQGVSEVAAKISISDLDAIIGRLVRVLSRSTVDASTSGAFEVTVPVLQARLSRGRKQGANLVRTLAALERLCHDNTSMNFLDAEEQTINRHLKAQTDVRRALWQQRFAAATKSPSAFTHVLTPKFGEVEVDDLAWLWARSRNSGKGQPNHASFVLQRLWSRLSPTERASFLNGNVSPKLRAHLVSLSNSAEQLEAQRRQHEEAQRRKDEETRRNNEKKLAKKRARIEAGEDLHALQWAWELLEGPGVEHARLNPERLRRFAGEEYVAVFLRGLRACWRRIDVELPNPGEGKAYAVLVGLTGVALDVRAGLDFSTLTSSEVERASRIGLYELNAFPFWYADLARAHPKAVRRALADVLALEWDHADEAHGVIRFGPRSEQNLSEMMRSLVLELLDARPAAHPRTLGYAADVILTSTNAQAQVIALVRRDIERAGSGMPDPNWIRIWAHVEPEAAADWVAQRVMAAPDTAMPVFLKAAALLEHDLDERFGRTASTSLMSPSALGRWVRLLLSLVKLEDDLEHHDVYSPNDRDHAQDLRGRLVARLASNPTLEARTVLLGMLDDASLTTVRPVIERMLKRQHAVAVEASVTRWTEEDVLGIERNDEKLPRSVEELFELVKAHLGHVHNLVANDDFSYRDLFKPRGKDKETTKEREIQLWVASCLRQRARGLYSVVRENVVDDDKEVDISAFSAGVGHVPIEIKPLGPYSVKALEEIMDRQLLGQYMQPPDRRCGVLLLVRRDDRKWDVGGKRSELSVLVEHLRAHARALGAQHGKVIDVAVIDLLARAPGAKTAAVRPKGKKPVAKEKKKMKEKEKRKRPRRTPSGTS